jgi:steroid 5-alpha reductase family enzyme
MDTIFLQDLLIKVSLGLLIFFHLFYAIALIKKDYSVIDIAWGLGFVLVAFISYQINPTPQWRTYLVLVCVSLWGLRLGAYLLIRNIKKKGEDFRYEKMRKEWGNNANIHAYFKIFLAQPILLFFISFPICVTLGRSTVPLNFFDVIGLSVFFIGFFIESIADTQMMAFKADPKNKGKLIRVGLWKGSRHPNYFGEMLVWWGLGFIALNSVLPSVSFLGALMITYLLAKVTGVPMLEEKYKDRPDFEDYIESTNAFIPKLGKK